MGLISHWFIAVVSSLFERIPEYLYLFQDYNILLRIYVHGTVYRKAQSSEWIQDMLLV